MSLEAIEKAINEHFAEEIRGQDPERQTDIVVNWVLGLTVSGIRHDPRQGREAVFYSNVAISPDGDPNAQANLAQFVSDTIARSLLFPSECTCEEED